MGKASRTKRERRDTHTTQPALQPPRTRRPIPVFWITIATIILGGIVTLVLTAPDDEQQSINKATEKVPAYADVTTEGASLPAWDGSSKDAAEGEQVPELRGTKFDGMRATYSPSDGKPRVYVVLAHWCPHCRDEVPRLVEWAREHPKFKGVEFVALSTAVSDSQPNFPPSAWLAQEQWPWDVLIDDEIGTGAEALGVEGFPFLVFADRHGAVQRRFSGEMPIDDFDEEVRALTESDTGP